nr:unnamed protein product [Digitaria exilis]
MSSYQSLLSLSPADWIGESEFADDDRSAVSSYLSFEATGEECCHHNPPEAAFHADQRAPEAPPLFDTLEADYCESGMAGSSSEGEPGRHSQADK